MTLGTFLAKRREDLGLSQRDVAKAADVQQPTVCAWERDEAAPRPSKYRRVAKAYRTTVATIAALAAGIRPAREARAS